MVRRYDHLLHQSTVVHSNVLESANRFQASPYLLMTEHIMCGWWSDAIGVPRDTQRACDLYHDQAGRPQNADCCHHRQTRFGEFGAGCLLQLGWA